MLFIEGVVMFVRVPVWVRCVEGAAEMAASLEAAVVPAMEGGAV